jgi:hypothetical protein
MRWGEIPMTLRVKGSPKWGVRSGAASGLAEVRGLPSEPEGLER